MNLSNLFGFVIALAVFVTAVASSTSQLVILMDVHALLIVVGGTGAASLICFSLPTMLKLMRVFFRTFIFGQKYNYGALIAEITLLANAKQKGAIQYEQAIGVLSDPFLKDAAEALFWVESDVPIEQLRDMLETRAGTHFERYMDQANIFKTMAKFPPAFGLLGTTLAMIALLQSLGEGRSSRSEIGPAMAIGLVATLYGVAITNFILIPISENLTTRTKEDAVARRMVVEGAMLVHLRMPPKFVEEKLKSFLLPSERPKVGQRKLESTSSSKKAA